MKAITLTQPWATLMALGEKHYETRGWPTNYRGDLAIHAAKGWTADDRDLCRDDDFALALTRGLGCGREEAIASVDAARGHVLAVVDLVGCHATDGYLAALTDDGPRPAPLEANFGNYTAGRYAFATTNLRPLARPVPMRGMLSIYALPPEVEAEIAVQLAETACSRARSGVGRWIGTHGGG